MGDPAGEVSGSGMVVGFEGRCFSDASWRRDHLFAAGLVVRLRELRSCRCKQGATAPWRVAFAPRQEKLGPVHAPQSMAVVREYPQLRSRLALQ